MKIIINFFLLLSTLVGLNAQQSHFCSMEQLFSKNKKLIEAHSYPSQTTLRSDSVLYIRTVIHVVYSSPEEDIPDYQIDSILNDLNDIDTTLIHPDHRSLMTDTKIQLCLADTDPNNLPTTGITHTETEVSSFDTPNALDSVLIENVKQDSLGGVSAWDTDRYLNVWIAPMDGSYGVPHRSYYPLGVELNLGISTQGAVVNVSHFLDDPMISRAVNVFGHEIGHVLGLFHTWGWPNSVTCEFDDFIDDTEKCDIRISDCLEIDDTCIDTLNNKVDNVSNFMAYGCMQMFTPGQVEAMRNNILNISPGLVLDNDSCNEMSTSTVEKNESDSQYLFDVFPNPSNGNFNIAFEQKQKSHITLRLYNSRGKLLRSFSVHNSNTLQKEIKSRDFNSGIIYVVIGSEDNTVSTKLLLNK